MNTSYIIKQLRSYRKILNRSDSSIGSLIRHHRAQTRLTLDDVADGICSVSYLCKVEKSQIIPSKKKLPLILRRLNINEDSVSKISELEYIDEIILSKHVSKELLLKYEDKIDYKAKLVKLAFNIFQGSDVEKTNEILNDLANYIHHFHEDEVCFYLYLTTKFYLDIHKFVDILLLNKELKSFNIAKNIKVEIQLIKLKALYKLELTTGINSVKPKVVELLIAHSKINDILEISFLDTAYNLRKGHTSNLDKLKTKITKLNNSEKIYLLFLNEYQKENFKEALKEIEKLKEVSAYYYMRYIILLHKMKKEDELINAINTSSLRLPKSYEIIVKYLKATKAEKTKYIRTSIIYTGETIEEKFFLDFIYAEAINNLKENYLYKETVIFLENYNNIINKHNDIII